MGGENHGTKASLMERKKEDQQLISLAIEEDEKENEPQHAKEVCKGTSVEGGGPKTMLKDISNKEGNGKERLGKKRKRVEVVNQGENQRKRKCFRGSLNLNNKKALMIQLRMIQMSFPT